jgi:hypothetical protein
MVILHQQARDSSSPLESESTSFQCRAVNSSCPVQFVSQAGSAARTPVFIFVSIREYKKQGLPYRHRLLAAGTIKLCGVEFPVAPLLPPAVRVGGIIKIVDLHIQKPLFLKWMM